MTLLKLKKKSLYIDVHRLQTKESQGKYAPSFLLLNFK